MIYTQWPNECNSKFFSFNSKPKDNVLTTEFISGRTVGFLKNSKNIMTISCSIRFDKTEQDIFWNWFNDDLGQTAGAFICPALGDKYYKFTSIPEPEDTNQRFRVLKLEIKEIY